MPTPVKPKRDNQQDGEYKLGMALSFSCVRFDHTRALASEASCPQTASAMSLPARPPLTPSRTLARVRGRAGDEVRVCL